MRYRQSGFTIVELLIVIVVIAILAAISIVAYNGIQERARDSQRAQDVKTIAKAMELFYTDKGYYPNSTTYTPGSATINSSWATTADVSWANLENQLKPYLSGLPKDPVSTPSVDIRNNNSGYNYQIFVNQSSYCGVAAGQAYIINYRFEGRDQEDVRMDSCSTNPLGPYPSSDYRVVK